MDAAIDPAAGPQILSFASARAEALASVPTENHSLDRPLRQPDRGRVGLLAGAGAFPIRFAQAARAAGHEVFGVGICGMADPALGSHCDGYREFTIYLGGYAVECGLKAMLLSAVPATRRGAEADKFRGTAAHDYRWLLHRYLLTGAPPPPREVQRSLSALAAWNTAIRYSPAATPMAEASRFLRAAAEVVQWADRRTT